MRLNLMSSKSTRKKQKVGGYFRNQAALLQGFVDNTFSSPKIDIERGAKYKNMDLNLSPSGFEPPNLGEFVMNAASEDGSVSVLKNKLLSTPSTHVTSPATKGSKSVKRQLQPKPIEIFS